MAGHTAQPEFTGIQKYPGIIAIVFTIFVSTVFIGALYNVATSSHHGDHGGDHGGEHAEDAH